MSLKHPQPHIRKQLYLAKNDVLKVVKYLKSINLKFSTWVALKIKELIKEKNL
jgi:hypothetical protein